MITAIGERDRDECMPCQVYWRLVDRLVPRTAEPRDLSTVLEAVQGRVVCPASNRLCSFHLNFIDNEVLMLTSYRMGSVWATGR